MYALLLTNVPPSAEFCLQFLFSGDHGSQVDIQLSLWQHLLVSVLVVVQMLIDGFCFQVVLLC